MAQPRLTEAEARVMRLVAAGFRAEEIAEALDLSRATVAWHLGQAYRKLGLGPHSTQEDRQCTSSP
jgi:DNA-binding CsgD family transcriptional regulator